MFFIAPQRHKGHKGFTKKKPFGSVGILCALCASVVKNMLETEESVDKPSSKEHIEA
jgi:hypothetical protein